MNLAKEQIAKQYHDQIIARMQRILDQDKIDLSLYANIISSLNKHERFTGVK